MGRLAKKILRNQRGAALMMAIIAMMVMTFLAVEVSHETLVEYKVSTGDYHQLKAFYAAKAGVELAVLRIHLYQQLVAQYGTNPQAKPLIDKIWSFPLSWPIKPPADMDRVSREEITGAQEESLMDSEFITQINGESGRLDINDLGSPSKELAAGVRKQLVQLLQGRLDQDDDWARDNRGMNIEELVNDIQDWVDDDQESLNGGAEDAKYPDAKSTFIPPNRGFKTIQELHMVKGVTDEIYEIIAPNVTVYGVKGINVNYADPKVLMSIDPQITQETADDIVSRRDKPEYGPFVDMRAFESYLTQEAKDRVDLNTFNQSKIPLYFDAEYNFRIRSFGMYNDSSREIIAIIYDFDTIKSRVEKLMTTSTTTTTTGTGGSGAGGVTPTTTTTSTTSGPKAPPQLIYWYEG